MDNSTHNKLQDLLLLALKAEGAEMGLIRNFVPDDDELVIVCHHGLGDKFVSQFHSVKPFDHTSCGRAFGIASTVLINDIEQDLSFKKQIKFLKELDIEFRAVKSVPILTPKGRKVGILSILFREPKWEWHFTQNDSTLLGIAEILYGMTIREMNGL